ncbi:MAG: O-methyltransferase [Acidimicrobiales bacterium]
MTDIADPNIEAYATEHCSAEPENLQAVAAATIAEHADAQMMVGRLEGGFLAMLVHCLRPALVLEVGTFTGYSALSMAEALPEGGRIVTCELDPTHAAAARANISESPFSSRIDLREGPALATIASIPAPVDFCFIDADKISYLDYFEAVLDKLAPSGLIAADNTLWSGQVLDPSDISASTEALRHFNDTVAVDPRVKVVMLTVRDGVTLIRRTG